VVRAQRWSDPAALKPEWSRSTLGAALGQCWYSGGAGSWLQGDTEEDRGERALQEGRRCCGKGRDTQTGQNSETEVQRDRPNEPVQTHQGLPESTLDAIPIQRHKVRNLAALLDIYPEYFP